MIRVRTVLNGWPGAPGLNTFYWAENAADPEAAATEAYNAVLAFWDDLKGLFPNDFNAVVEQTVDILEAETGELLTSYGQTGGNVVNGTEAAYGFLPGQTMAFIGFRTGTPLNGRRVRGGTYIGPMHENTNNENGQIETVSLAVIGPAAATLIEDLPSGALLSVWHRPTFTLVDGEPQANNDGATYPIIDAQTRPVWAHLSTRRR